MGLNEKKKILVISQFYIPDITAAAYRISDMVNSIKNMYETDIITSFPHKSDVKVVMYESNVHRVNISSKCPNRLVRYSNEYFGFMIKSLVMAQKLKKRYDYVFVTSPPIFTLVAGYLIAKQKKARLIIDIRDIWPDVLLDDGTFKKSGLVYRILKKLECFMYRKADRITCVSKYMQKYIEELSGKRVDVIYNGVSSQQEITLNHLRKEQDSKDIRNIFYTGNVGFYQHLDVLFKCGLDHPDIFSYFRFHIVGEGTEYHRFQGMIENHKLDGIHLYGAVPKDKTTQIVLDEADLLFLNLHNSTTLEKTIPSKLFDYLFFNLPIVYGILGEGKEILDDIGCGRFFQWNDADSLYDSLLDVYKNYKDYKICSEGNRQFVCERFSREEMFRRFWEGVQC